MSDLGVGETLVCLVNRSVYDFVAVRTRGLGQVYSGLPRELGSGNGARADCMNGLREKSSRVRTVLGVGCAGQIMKY